MSLKIAFTASRAPVAQTARAALIGRYGDVPPQEADVIVALGGDGFMLHTLHGTQDLAAPVYGMNRGTIGFLMNAYGESDLIERLQAAEREVINPLVMRAYRCCAQDHRRRSCRSPWMDGCGCRSWSVTGRWWRHPRDRPPTTIPRMVRFCRLGRTCWH